MNRLDDNDEDNLLGKRSNISQSKNELTENNNQNKQSPKEKIRKNGDLQKL